MKECSYDHMNGFEHLDSGAEEGFHLAFKFEKRDARTPFWVLYVSGFSTGPGLIVEGTWHFADALASDERSDDVARTGLLARARPHIVEGLRALKAGKPPRTSMANPQSI
jgi:hypothetical protein